VKVKCLLLISILLTVIVFAACDGTGGNPPFIGDDTGGPTVEPAPVPPGGEPNDDNGGIQPPPPPEPPDDGGGLQPPEPPVL